MLTVYSIILNKHRVYSLYYLKIKRGTIFIICNQNIKIKKILTILKLYNTSVAVSLHNYSEHPKTFYYDFSLALSLAF